MKVVEGTITSRFGMRMHPTLHVLRMHNGVDVSAKVGTPVYCPRAGIVLTAENNKTAGNYVRITSGTLTFVFMHLSSFSVSAGQRVIAGQQIGKVGATGTVTAPHLHFEVHLNNNPINPESYLNF